MKAIYKYFIPALLLLLPACQREEMLPEPAVGGSAQGIPLELEDLATRMEVAPVTGACTWTDGDQIGLYLTGGDADAYVSATVNATSRIATPASAIGPDQAVGGYAVYPYDMRGNGATPTVNYLTTYNMSGRDLSNVSSAPNVPMLAAGNSDLLRFYHVGAMMRLSLVDMPSNTNRIRVTFEGMTDVTGEATVSDPGSRKASAAITTGTGNVVTFTNITLPEGTMYLTVPLPAQDYGALTGMKVEAMNGGSVVATFYCPVTSSWGALKHGDALPYPVDFISVIHLPGYTGKIRGLYLSPGILKWDPDMNNGDGGYTITDGSDQLELLNYYKVEDVFKQYWHSYNNPYGNRYETLRYRLDGSLRSGDLVNRYIVEDGVQWRIPSADDWNTIIGNSAINSTLSGAGSIRYCTFRIDLTGSPYAGKGVYDSGSGNDVQRGIMFFPDNTVINCPGLKVDYVSMSGTSFEISITYTTYLQLVEAGCMFLPSAGRYSDNGGWFINNLNQGDYWTSTNLRALQFYGGVLEFYVALGNYFMPVRLVHN